MSRPVFFNDSDARRIESAVLDYEASGPVIGIAGSSRPRLSGRRIGWNGAVIFHNLIGVECFITGTAAPFIQVFRDLGTANYYSGPQAIPWPEGTEIILVSDLPNGAYHVF